MNVIPREVEFGGTLRTTNVDDRDALIDHVRRISQELASLHRAGANVEIRSGSPPVNNDARLVASLDRTIRRLFGDEAVFLIPRPSMGAEDFAHYLDHVPGMLIRVGTCSGPDTAYPLHDSQFDIDESAMPLASRVVAQTLIRYLRHHAGDH